MLRLERWNAVPFQLYTREVGHRMAPSSLMKAMDELATLNEPLGLPSTSKPSPLKIFSLQGYSLETIPGAAISQFILGHSYSRNVVYIGLLLTAARASHPSKSSNPSYLFLSGLNECCLMNWSMQYTIKQTIFNLATEDHQSAQTLSTIRK